MKTRQEDTHAAKQAWKADHPLLTGSSLVVLCGLLPALNTGCGAARHDPPLAKGWSWYHDAKYLFQVPVPPGWSTATFLDTLSPTDDCAYIVDLFPPGVHPGDLRGIEEHEPRMMSIGLNLNCSPTDISNDNAGSVHWVAESTPITVSGQSMVLYDRVRDIAPPPGAERILVGSFGGHQFVFYFQSDVFGPHNPDMSARDLPLYTYLLRHFLYTGPTDIQTTVPG
ncbi:MAG: hypothetical protein ACRDHE_08010 [Ktedonobacterales bacterium]